jgi:hypothetical protein
MLLLLHTKDTTRVGLSHRRALPKGTGTKDRLLLDLPGRTSMAINLRLLASGPP